MKNFKLIGGFGIAEKEISKRMSNKNKETVIKEIIDKYLKLGIEEFFIGYNPDYWNNIYGFEFSPNGRFGENEQITTYDTLKKSIEYIHSNKINGKTPKVFLTLNFRYYSDLVMPLIEKILNDGISAGIDGVIVGNPEILVYLAEIGYKGEIHTSTILVHYNIDAIEYIIDFCKNNNLNLTRMILPRELTIKEIENICNKFPDMKFEVFGQSDYCRYANGYCLAEHKYFSRDLCGFVLKHGLEVKKRIRYDFKKIILSELSDYEKQEMLNNEINDIFIKRKISGDISNKTFEINKEDFEKKLKITLLTNFYSLIYDGLEFKEHNNHIDKIFELYEKYKNEIKDNFIHKEMEKLKKINQKIKNNYENLLKKYGKYKLMAIQKFLMYNRDSLPIYHIFNNIKNIEMIKIPLRGRDLNIFNLNLNNIDEALREPKNFINETNLCLKYFHYDISNLDIYKEVLDKLSK